jgi:hypothetical protein
MAARTAASSLYLRRLWSTVATRLNAATTVLSIFDKVIYSVTRFRLRGYIQIYLVV